MILWVFTELYVAGARAGSCNRVEMACTSRMAEASCARAACSRVMRQHTSSEHMWKAASAPRAAEKLAVQNCCHGAARDFFWPLSAARLGRRGRLAWPRAEEAHLRAAGGRPAPTQTKFFQMEVEEK